MHAKAHIFTIAGGTVFSIHNITRRPLQASPRKGLPAGVTMPHPIGTVAAVSSPMGSVR
jgi:hypothetical protein